MGHPKERMQSVSKELKRLSGAKVEEETGSCRKLHNENHLDIFTKFF
jgi:hypothetical protein